MIALLDYGAGNLRSVQKALQKVGAEVILATCPAEVEHVGGVVLPALGSFYRERLGITSTGAMWAVILGGSMAILGGVRDGQVLKAILGDRGDALMHQLLGPQYPAILPVILSLAVMLGVSRVTRRQR